MKNKISKEILKEMIDSPKGRSDSVGHVEISFNSDKV